MKEQKKYKRWTKEEVAILKESNDKRTIHEIYEVLKSRPKSSIKKKMESLGYSPLLTKFEWSSTEAELLLKCSDKRIGEVVEILPKRTEESIRAKARQLNVRILSNTEWTEKEEGILKTFYPSCKEATDITPLLKDKTIAQIRSKIKTMKLKKNALSIRELSSQPDIPIECFVCGDSYLIEENMFPKKTLPNGERVMSDRTCSICRNKRGVISNYKRLYGIILEFDLMFNTYSIEQWYKWKEVHLTPNGSKLRQLPEILHTEENIARLGRYVVNKVMCLNTREELASISQVDMELYGIAFSRTPFILNSPINIITLCFPELDIKEWEFNSVTNSFWESYNNFLSALSHFFENHQSMIDEFGYDAVFNRNYMEENFSRLNSAKNRHYSDKSWETCLKDIGVKTLFKKDRKIGYDGTRLDSIEETWLYDFLHQQLDIKVVNIGRKRGIYLFHDKTYRQNYIPDFVLKRSGKKDLIIEYFGMYTNRQHNKVYTEYRKKTHQKIKYFNSRDDIHFLALYPDDLKKGFLGVKEKLRKIDIN